MSQSVASSEVPLDDISSDLETSLVWNWRLPLVFLKYPLMMPLRIWRLPLAFLLMKAHLLPVVLTVQRLKEVRPSVKTSNLVPATSGLSEMHPYVCSGDLGLVVKLKSERSLTDAEKFYLLKNHFVPSKGFKFPSCVINGQKRCFQASWLKKYSGLTYSQSEGGGFCLHCVLFGQCEPSVKELGVLVNN